MSVKTIKTKRRLLYVVYRSLKNIPPKDFATTEEIKATISDILPELEGPVEKFNDVIVRAEEVNSENVAGIITPEQTKERVDKLNEEWRIYNDAHGNDVITIRFKSQALKILKDQFDKWGKNWFQNIEDFAEFSDDLEKKEDVSDNDNKDEKGGGDKK